MAQPVGPLFGTRWPNRGPVPVPARTFPALALLGAKKFQVRSQYGSYAKSPGPCGPKRREGQNKKYGASTRFRASLNQRSRRLEPRRNWLLGGFAAALAISCGMGDLGGFTGAAEVHADEVNDLVSRSRHLVSAALPVPCAFSSAFGPPLAAPLACRAVRTNIRDPCRLSGPESLVLLLLVLSSSCLPREHDARPARAGRARAAHVARRLGVRLRGG